jgi:hypothetical protein
VSRFPALSATLVCVVALTIIHASSTASSQTRPAALPPSLKLTVAPSGSARVPKDVPELSAAAMQVARTWRSDALIVSLEYQEVNAPNVKGPEVKVRAWSDVSRNGGC